MSHKQQSPQFGLTHAQPEPARDDPMEVHHHLSPDHMNFQPYQAIAPKGTQPMDSKRMLIVDDDHQILEMLKITIESLYPDCEIITATSAFVALEIVTLRDMQPFDLILTDYDMPGINGLDLARAARQKWPDLRVVLMSGSPDSSWLRDKVTALNLSGYIRKPFGLDQLDRIL